MQESVAARRLYSARHRGLASHTCKEGTGMSGYTDKAQRGGQFGRFKHFMFARLRHLPQAALIGPLPRTDAMFIYGEATSRSSRAGHAVWRLSRHDESYVANENMKHESIVECC